MVKPFDSRIVIKQDKAESSKVGNIIITASAKEPPNRGTVIALGPKVSDLNDVHVDDKVLLPNGAGVEVEIGNEKYIIIEENEILAKLI